MPRILIDVSESWWERFNSGIRNAIDTLDGISNQISHNEATGQFEDDELLDIIHTEIKHLRRQLETWKLPF